jgi:hypothetical protein
MARRGRRGRELNETRKAWDETQREIAASPLACKDPYDLACPFIRENLIQSQRCPDVPILSALHAAAERIFEDEDIGPFEPRWNAIVSDAALAVEFRKVIARRRRCATDFDRIQGMITGPLLSVVHRLVERLPESCFWRPGDGDAAVSFEVPPIELLEDPAEFIGALFVAPCLEGF